MNIWNTEELIIDHSGKKTNQELLLKENIPGKEEIKRYVKIEDGKVIEKPEDIDLIGKRTSKGFILEGLKINQEIKKKCIICDKCKNILDFWDKDKNSYSNVCNECREDSFIDKEDCDECWIR
jgi:hypothetical protein